MKILICLSVFLLSLQLWAQCPGSPPAGTDCVAATASKSITAFSTCKTVTNNHGSGKAIMIPINTNTEWTSFYSNAPGGVTISACAPTCAGTSVGGYCWYYGTGASGCDTVCGTHGGYNAATETYVGSSGTLANCRAVMIALGQSQAAGSSYDSSGIAIGCANFGSGSAVFRYYSPATTSSASSGAYRACACNN